MDFVSPLRRLSLVERAALEEERRTFNTRRTRVFSPVMMVLHATFAVNFALQSGHAPEVLGGYRVLSLVHLGFLCANSLLWVLRRAERVERVVGEIFFMTYLTYGVVVSTVAQLTSRNTDVYLVVMIATAAVLRIHAIPAAIGSTVALVALLAGVSWLQSDPVARASALNNAVPVTVIAWIFGRAQLGAFVSDLLQRRTIQTQRDALEQANVSLDEANRELAERKATLEVRVRDQVSEIVERAAEIARLDEHLRANVKERSADLGRVIAAVGRTFDGSMAPGTELAGRFVIGRLLGRGGMGAVYEARDRRTDEALAVKVLHGVPDVAALQRFVREVATMAGLRHGAIARSYAIDITADGRPYQVQELVHGTSLERELAHRIVFRPAHAARIGAVLADALAAAHASGVIHRDVKPGNVLLTTTKPGLKLLDFGISKLTEAAPDEDGTRPSVAIGTPAFMAPEQISNPTGVTVQADVHALGLTLYLLLSGRLPYAGASPAELLLAHVARTPEPLASAAPDVPRALADLVMSCLAKDPDDRPTARNLAAALSRAADALDAPDLDAMNVAAAAGSEAVTTEASALATAATAIS